MQCQLVNVGVMKTENHHVRAIGGGGGGVVNSGRSHRRVLKSA